MDLSPEEPPTALIATPVGFLTREQFGDYMLGYARRQLIKVYELQPGQVLDAPADEVYRLLNEAREASPHLADQEEDDDVVTSDETAHLDRAAPAHTTHITLGVEATDPEIQRLVHQLLLQFSQTQLAQFLASGDPLAVSNIIDPDVCAHAGPAEHQVRLQITTSDDDTADALLDLLECFARESVRPALDAAHPGKLAINLHASDGSCEWY